MKWDPKEWLERAVAMQKAHPFVKVELSAEEARELLRYISSLEELNEELKKKALMG